MKHALLLLSAAVAFAQAPAPVAAVKVAPEELDKLREGVKPLTAKVSALSKNPLIADVAVYEKAVQNLLRYNDEFYAANYVKFAQDALATGLARAEALAKGAAGWTKETGRVMRAYKSKVDDSVQPYKLSIPAGYDPAKPIRLDVILHGRNARLTEASFLALDP